MKVANMVTFKIVLYVLVCVLCVSCTGAKFEQDGYVVVKNRLRLKHRSMPYPTTNGVLKVAAQIGRLPADLVIHGFKVTNGNLTIHGKDGELRLLPEGNAEVVKTGYGTKKFMFRYPAVTLVLIDTPYEASRQMIQFQRVMSHAQDFPNHNDEGYWGMSPRLYSSTSNGFHLISIPYTVSPDFQGDMGKATLMSNWYDF